MTETVHASGRLLAKNFLFNLAGQFAPVVVALLAIPYVLHGLGTERFGLLSIAWVFLGYFNLFNFGLARATTKFVADCIGRREFERLPKLIWTSVALQAAFGLLGAALVACTAHLLVERALRITVPLQPQAMTSFLIMAAGMPFVMLSIAFRGVLAALQRFDLINLVKAPVNAGLFLLPALAVLLHMGLPASVALLAILQLASTVAYFLLCVYLLPGLRHSFGFEAAQLKRLFIFSGWVTVSSTLGPVMSYMDRFVIGAVISVASLAYYTAPFDAITRAAVVAGALTSTLFPAFSTLHAAEAREHAAELCARSIKSIVLVLGPPLLLVVFFAHAILRLWLGAGFAAKSTGILQILAIGTLLNCVSYFPSSLLDAVGRPDLSAKLHLCELPIYAALLVLSLVRVGIAGAAVAWTTRIALDAVLLFVLASRFGYLPAAKLWRGIRATCAVLLGWVGVSLIVALLVRPLLLRAAVTAASTLLLAVAIWKFALESTDRSFITETAQRIRSVAGSRRAIASGAFLP